MFVLFRVFLCISLLLVFLLLVFLFLFLFSLVFLLYFFYCIVISLINNVERASTARARASTSPETFTCGIRSE